MQLLRYIYLYVIYCISSATYTDLPAQLHRCLGSRQVRLPFALEIRYIKEGRQLGVDPNIAHETPQLLRARQGPRANSLTLCLRMTLRPSFVDVIPRSNELLAVGCRLPRWTRVAIR